MEQFIQKYPYNQLFENNADSHFYMKIGGTVYDVTTHYDPKGRQCVLEQFKELLLQKEWRQPHNRKGQPKSIYDNFLNEFTKQFRVKAVEEFRPTFQKVY